MRFILWLCAALWALDFVLFCAGFEVNNFTIGVAMLLSVFFFVISALSYHKEGDD